MSKLVSALGILVLACGGGDGPSGRQSASAGESAAPGNTEVEALEPALPSAGTDAGPAAEAAPASPSGSAGDAVPDAGALAPAEAPEPPVEPCVADTDCASGCCAIDGADDGGSGACAPADVCEAPPAIACAQLVLRADDGTFLGDATAFITPDSVCNPAGDFGSAASPTSIFNPAGTFGNTFGAQSAYATFTLTPPRLYCATTDTVLVPVSKNTGLVDAIDPDALCDVLAANRL